MEVQWSAKLGCLLPSIVNRSPLVPPPLPCDRKLISLVDKSKSWSLSWVFKLYFFFEPNSMRAFIVLHDMPWTRLGLPCHTRIWNFRAPEVRQWLGAHTLLTSRSALPDFNGTLVRDFYVLGKLEDFSSKKSLIIYFVFHCWFDPNNCARKSSNLPIKQFISELRSNHWLNKKNQIVLKCILPSPPLHGSLCIVLFL